jgi:3-methyladenine DNA glycosylase Tag
MRPWIEADTFDTYVWRFVDGVTVRHRWKQRSQVPVKTAQSEP